MRTPVVTSIRWRYCVVLFCGILFTSSLVKASAQDDLDWSMQRRDAVNTSYVPTTIKFPLKLVWRKKLEKEQFGLFASQGILCTTEVTERGSVNKNTVLLYDAATAQVRARIPDASALYFKNDTLILLSDGDANTSDKLLRYSWKTKQRLWECSLGGKAYIWGMVERKERFYLLYTSAAKKFSDAPVSSPPVAPGPHLIAIDFETGEVAARVAEGALEDGWGYGPPAVDDEFICFGISHNLYFFNPDTLAPAARTIYDGGNYLPMLTNTHILTQGWLHHVNGIRRDRTGGWGFSAPRGTGHSLSIDRNGKAILAESLSEPVGLSGIAVDTGKIQWHVPLLVGSVAGAKNVFLVSGWNNSVLKNKKHVPPDQTPGGLYAFDATTGKRLWKYTRPGLRIDSVIISSDRVYGVGGGYLYCFASHP